MATYFYSPLGMPIGYLDRTRRSLYDRSGELIGNFSPERTRLFNPDGSTYGYVTGREAQFLTSGAGFPLGSFHPPLGESKRSERMGRAGRMGA